MKYLFVIGILLLSVSVHAQTASIASSSSTTTAPAKDDSKKEVKTTGIEIPPEKRTPISIPKITVPLIIDGKIEEELW